MKPRPIWLEDKIREGERKASMATCSGCSAHVIAGLDNDRCALFVIVDLQPVGRLDELRALMAGRYSYRLIGREIVDRHHVVDTPYPVHLEHRCPGGTP